MAVASNTVRRGTVLPVDAARWAMWTFVIVNVVIVEALFLSAGPGKNGVLTVAKFFGLHAALLMLFQLLLVARLPWLDRRIGMDRLTVWHRWVGFSLLWTVLTHATLVVLGYANLDDASMGKTFFALAGVPASLLGMLAAAVIVVIAAVSTRPLRRRLRYEVWHGLHLLLYVASGPGVRPPAAGDHDVHVLRVRHGLLVGAVAVRLRRPADRAVVVPLWRNAYHRFRVAAVVPESDDVVSVYVTGRHLDKLPGQGGPVLHLAVPRAQPLVAGQPLLAVGGARRPRAAPHGEGGGQHQCRPAATSRSAAAPSSKDRTGRSPRCTGPGPAPC